MFDTESFKIAAAKFEELGSLAVTAQDHRNIGSTPPKRLLENPDKTLGELMSEEETSAWIKENEKAILEFSEMDPNGPFVQTALPVLKMELDLGLKYLKNIGKL